MAIKFFTPVQTPNLQGSIKFDSRIMTIGSCFSDHIGQRLTNHFFNTLVNPFGTIYNPMSMAKILDMTIENKIVEKHEIENHEERFFHYDFHSSFDNSNVERVENKINSAIMRTNEFIKSTDILIITFGSSIVYKLKSNNRLVSNCHKVPNFNFSKEFLSTDVMLASMHEILNKIKEVNPSIQIILTVSPVRHTKEGLIANNRSKSRLIDLCHQLNEVDPNISYFPAYEIMYDELRDYRYYESDLIHPNELAVDIIWSRFLEIYFGEKALQKVKDFGILNSAIQHRPFNPESEEHAKFKLSQLKKIDVLSKDYPEVDMSEIKKYFST